MSIKSKKTGYAESVFYDKPELSNSLIWNEWSDSELNSEIWDYPKNGDFVDPQEVPMPSSLQPKDWKRFRELENISPIVFEPISDYPDLIVNNKHLLHSEFMRCFVSTLINIQYCGRNGLQIENSSTNFSWNFAEQCWQGWFHVYSMNKAGKGVAHQPVVNLNGKYIVRIFFMGSWRRIFIDDAIPIDKRGRPLLPRTANKNEIWPMILAKAMLKIAGISWTKEREIVDCNFITCLTGWIGLSLNVSHLSPRDQWEFLTKYAKHFEWPQEDKAESSNLKIVDKESKKQSRKSKVNVKKKLQVPEEPRPTLLFLNLEDMRDVDAEEIPGITPCWNHQIYVELSRDVPLDPAQMKPPLAKWKMHRWLDWAIRRGIIDASEYFVPIRHLLIISPLREFNGDTMYAYDDSEDISEEDKSTITIPSNKRNPEETKSSATTTFTKNKIKDIELPEISLWGDFNKLSLYLREVQLFYRQKFFKYSIEISDISHQKMTLQDRKKSKSDQLSTRDGKKSATKSFTSAPTIFPQIYEYQDKTSQSRNEPLYLFVDSIEEKFFLINLSTFAEDNLSERKSSYLIIERYNFFQESTDNESVAEIITRGTKSTVLQLEAGRHLLRIFISSESSYHVTILSDTPFQIGNRCTMHEMMIAESERIKMIVTKISNCVKKVFESFGNRNHAENLKIYYGSYMPDLRELNNSNIKTFKSIHCYFQEELINLIRNRFSAEELKIIERALRIFFLDPSIGIQINPPFHREISEIDEDSNKNRAATLIQSFFRMFLIKHFKDIHEVRHKEHNRVKEALEKVVELFNYDKHESVAQTLLRSTVKRDKILKDLYPCSRDFKHVIQVQELKGRVSNVSPDQWIPIVRIVINAPPGKMVNASLDLFVNLQSYNLRVFANDTKREMIRIINNVIPTKYKYRKDGYTVFAYGWSDFQRSKEIEWNLHLTTMKDEPMFHWMESEELISPKNEIQSPIVQEISNIYIPNVRNLIAKISLRIRRRSLVSLRFKTSYEKTLIRLRVVDESGKTISEFSGSGSVIIPTIFLESTNDNVEKSLIREEEKPRKSKRSLTHRSGGSLSHRSSNVSKRDSSENPEKSDNSTRYFVEVYLREDSWPLTEAEWTVVAEAKAKVHIANKAKPRKSSNNARLSKTERPKSKLFSKRSLEVNEVLLQPYWILQIVNDAGNELEISEDRSEEDKIAELKKIWQTEESDRSERGRRLREKFLEENSLIIAPSAIDMTNEETRTNDDEKKIMDSFESLSDQILLETKRTLQPPADFGNYLPKLDLTIYMEKEDEEENSWVKCEYDEETLRNQRAMNILDFEQLQSNYLNDAAELMDRRRRKYDRIRKKYLENCANRARAVEEAYEARQTYIESTKTTTKSMKSVKSKESKQKKKA